MNIKTFSGFIKKVVIIDAISAVIVLLYWYLKGPQNLVNLVDSFSFGGIFLMIPGALIYAGPRPFLGIAFNKLNKPVQKTKDEQNRQIDEYKNEQKFHRTIGLMLLTAGVLLILIGLLIYAIGD
ncbi:MAG: hypothetical protein JW864_00900 [Spirochaetes bacterium]|nr:hypothetical protein [Spirochaetota bacterium]